MAGQERTIPIQKKPAIPTVRKPAPPPEPSPSPRSIEARRQMTSEEVEALNLFVSRLTESSAAVESVRDQRRLLFDIGNELKRLKPDSAQAEEALARMKGFQIELGGHMYVVEEYLTRGAFGAAFVVSDPATQKKEVLKLSLPFDRTEMFATPGASVKDVLKAEGVRNTIMEAAALSRLSQYDVPPGKPRQWLERKGPFPPFPLLKAAQFIPHPDDPDRRNPSVRIQALVMERIEGERLDQLVQRQNLVADSETLKRFVRELLQALQYLHRRGIFHSDLKLSNIIVDQDLHPYLIDFGSATVAVIEAQQRKKGTEKVVYGMVDNIFASKDYITGFEDPSAPRDVYALGVILRKIVQGDHLRRKTDESEKRQTIIPLAVQRIAEMAELMVKTEPAERPAIGQLLKQLETLS